MKLLFCFSTLTTSQDLHLKTFEFIKGKGGTAAHICPTGSTNLKKKVPNERASSLKTTKNPWSDTFSIDSKSGLTVRIT